jgi:hypothetical protein
MKINAIITGASGMVGEGVLHECILHTDVESILVVGRKPCGTVHPKLQELLIDNFFDLSSIGSKLIRYNACFFCLGVSSVGMKEEEYFKLTHDLTLNFARLLAGQNPNMTFCYISGAGTDSTGKGRLMWARVKGKTENDLLGIPFRKVYNFRPGMLEPTKGLKNTLKAYKYFGWLALVIRILAPNSICTLKQLGLAMINSVLKGYDKRVLEVSDIKKLGDLS